VILIDTSVWIDYFANRPTAQVEILDACLDQGETLCICGVILAEVLQGIRYQNEYRKVRSFFEYLTLLPMERETFVRAAEIHRFLRQRGLTVRKTIDCIIAAVALENDIALLHNDRDFLPVEKHFHLKTPKLPD
jgi:predicted nucleic acid-binding protein